MGTKNNPGPYDCYAKLESDEPYFVLRGKDPIGWLLVQVWVTLRKYMADDLLPTEYEKKLNEASDTANRMKDWSALKGTFLPGVLTPVWIRKAFANIAYGEFGRTERDKDWSPPPEVPLKGIKRCTCVDIMRDDSTRHFKGCPQRQE